MCSFLCVFLFHYVFFVSVCSVFVSVLVIVLVSCFFLFQYLVPLPIVAFDSVCWKVVLVYICVCECV